MASSVWEPEVITRNINLPRCEPDQENWCAEGRRLIDLAKGIAATDAANLQNLYDLSVALQELFQAADANLQAQLTGNVPLEASAFSPISWHEQVINNSVTIPENKNAWSFGPVMSIASGQSVTIGEGSFWTIANGEGQPGDPGPSPVGNLDYGVIQ